jgi:hypothetical protein
MGQAARQHKRVPAKFSAQGEKLFSFSMIVMFL